MKWGDRSHLEGFRRASGMTIQVPISFPFLMLKHCVLCVLHIFSSLLLEGSWTRPWFTVVVLHKWHYTSAQTLHIRLSLLAETRSHCLPFVSSSSSLVLPSLTPLSTASFLKHICHATPVLLKWYSWLPWANTSSVSDTASRGSSVPVSLILPLPKSPLTLSSSFSFPFLSLNYIFTLLF